MATTGLLSATVLWGFGAWWALLAGRVLRRVSTTNGGLGFHPGSWGFVFPTAAMAALTVELGRSWSSSFLSVTGAVFWLVSLAIWARLAFQTVAAVRDRSLCGLWAGPAIGAMHLPWGAGFLRQVLGRGARP